MNVSKILEAIESFKNLQILVIGDVILDAYIKGNVSRISPEAPVPVLDVNSREYRLGGAANVALNVKHLGASCTVCSVIGNDDPGSIVKQLLSDEGLGSDDILESSQRKTTLKSRLVSGFSQLIRMDEEMTHELSNEDEQRLFERIKDLIENDQPDAIIFEDYDKGVITSSLIKNVIDLARSKNIHVTVDPKRNHFFHYAGATLFKPNLKELREGLNLMALSANPSELEKAFAQLRKSMPVDKALFTLSGEGVYITDGEKGEHIKAMNRTIADVSGAGDTVIATATCGISSGLELDEIAFISNMAGGWVCQFPGVVSITSQDLKSEIEKAMNNGH